MHHAESLSPLDSSDKLDRAAVREAAGWLVLLHEDRQNPQTLEGLSQWRVADPEHERAWQRAQLVNDKFGLIPAQLGLPVLGHATDSSRRRAIKALVLLMTFVPASYVAYRSTPWREWAADYATRTGERRSLSLNDGTELELNTDTALDVQFDAVQRLIKLHRGEVLIDTGADPRRADESFRPFWVQTRQGRIRALGTRFVVRRDDDITRVQVYDGAVEVQPRHTATRQVIQAGQQLCFSADAVQLPRPVDPHGADWSRGLLVAQQMPLGEFTRELARYRPGLLRCDPAIADLRISGAFQLDNTDQVLAALPETLPVNVVYRTRFWVSVTAA